LNENIYGIETTFRSPPCSGRVNHRWLYLAAFVRHFTIDSAWQHSCAISTIGWQHSNRRPSLLISNMNGEYEVEEQGANINSRSVKTEL
jgi:hypothetical protein